MRFFSSAPRALAVLLLVVAWLVIPGCGSGGGGGTALAPTIPDPSGGGGAVNPLSPATVPGAPASLPPATQQARAAQLESVAGRTVTLNFPGGWSLVSFPLASLTSSSGFTYQLCSYQATGYTYVDPVYNPAGVDTTKAYWAYFDAPTAVTVVGPENAGEVTTAHLQAGWNMVGCPLNQPLPLRAMTVTRQAGATKVMEEATRDDILPGSAWVYRYVYRYQGSYYQTQDLAAWDGALQPQVGYWIFAWSEADLNLNVAPPSSVPNITSLSNATLTSGATLDLVGTGLGSAATGVVVVNGVTVPGDGILSWTSTGIRLTVPAGLSSGNLVVMVNRYPSNRVPVLVTSGGGGGGATGSLYGIVQSGSKAPLAGAQILLDTGHSAVSDAAGLFQIDGIAAGEHLVYVTLIGYRTAVGPVTIEAGQTKSVEVTLGSASGGGGGGGGGEVQGDLYVRAYPYSSGGDRFWAYRIEVSEQGNYSERWSDTWDVDTGNTYNELRADNAIVGRTYTIKVTWRNQTGMEHSNTWYRILDRDDQTESFYNW